METIERIRAWLLQNNYDGIVLNRRDNYAWVSGGADSSVLSSSDTGVAYYVIKREAVDLIADNSDLLRMAEEQNPLHGNPVLVPWYESVENFLINYTKAGRYVSDTGVAGMKCVQEKLVDLRLSLMPSELERYEAIGQECARIVEGVCQEASRGDSEKKIANLIKSRCIDNGISPDCVLVGADRRIMNYRHPMPTDKKIEKSLMVVLGGQKYGLNISITRMVYFGAVPEEIKERYNKTSHIFAGMQHIMKEGMLYRDFFGQVCRLYKEAGYEDEWKMHHQGGPTGYACREFVVTPDNEKQIHTGQAYAWNPTIQGTKCEETTYLSESGVKTFTRTENWPCITVETGYGSFQVADILVKD